MNKLFVTVLVLLALIGGFFWLTNYTTQEKQSPTDYKEATFTIEGKPVKIGEAGVEYFGNEVEGDLDGDLEPDDVAFLITQETGGSGTFFYVVGAIQTPNNTYNGTHALFLGDRIAPQPTEIRDGLVIVNYAQRRPDEPMTAQPSVGKSIWLKLDPETMQFGEVVQNFEGESAYAEECHDSPQYFVVTRGRADVGNDILVKLKASPREEFPCRYVVAEEDIEFTDENPTYYLGIAGHFLLLDSGTAPPPRGLDVYDLKLKKSVYTDRYNTPIEVGEERVTYWQPIDTKVDAKNCPKLQEYTSQGLGAGIERRVVLTLSALKVAPTGEERCSARQ